MFFLYGPAGTGKSAISHTIGKRMKDTNNLGSFFCFDRTVSAERTLVQALKNIAFDLAGHIASFGQSLTEILSTSPHLLSSGMEEHWQELIYKPAQKVVRYKPVVVVIDALDECGSDKKDKLASLLCSQVKALPSNFRLTPSDTQIGHQVLSIFHS